MADPSPWKEGSSMGGLRLLVRDHRGAGSGEELRQLAGVAWAAGGANPPFLVEHERHRSAAHAVAPAQAAGRVEQQWNVGGQGGDETCTLGGATLADRDPRQGRLRR